MRWPAALSALTPGERREHAEVWAIAGELVTEAVRMVVEADALEDGRARARLLASTNHTLTQDILGAFLPEDAVQDAAADLAARLDEIDRTPDEGDKSGGGDGRAGGPRLP